LITPDKRKKKENALPDISGRKGGNEGKKNNGSFRWRQKKEESTSYLGLRKSAKEKGHKREGQQNSEKKRREKGMGAVTSFRWVMGRVLRGQTSIRRTGEGKKKKGHGEGEGTGRSDRTQKEKRARQGDGRHLALCPSEERGEEKRTLPSRI